MADIHTNLELDEITIAAASHQCLESFATCLAQASLIHPREFSRVEDQAERFSTWTSGIGVFAPGRASLDHRLRYAPEVQSVPIGLLYSLNHHIRKCSDIIDGHGKNPESDVSTLTKALERSHSDIASEISHFNKLSNMIRRTSKEHQTSKMKNIQVKDEDEDVERMLLYIFTGYISNKFPRASDIIQQRLAEAMILRRKRVLCDKSEAEVCGRLGNHVTSLLRSLALKSLPPYEEDMEADVGSERDGCDGSELHSVRTIDDLSIGNSSSTYGMNDELSKLSETEEADFVNDAPYDLSSRHTDMWSSWVNDWISNKPTLQHLQQMYDAKDPMFYFMLEKAKERLALPQIPPQQQQQQPISSQSPEEIPPPIEANTLASNVSQTPVWYSMGGLEAVDLRDLGPLIPGYIINSSDVPGVTEQGLEEMHICSEQLDPLVPHRGQPSA